MNDKPRRLRWLIPALLVIAWLGLGGFGGPFAAGTTPHRRSNRSIRTVAIRRATGVLTAIHMEEDLPTPAGDESPESVR